MSLVGIDKMRPPAPGFQYTAGSAIKSFAAMTVKELLRHKRMIGLDQMERIEWQAAWDRLTLLRPLEFTQTDPALLVRSSCK